MGVCFNKKKQQQIQKIVKKSELIKPIISKDNKLNSNIPIQHISTSDVKDMKVPDEMNFINSDHYPDSSNSKQLRTLRTIRIYPLSNYNRGKLKAKTKTGCLYEGLCNSTGKFIAIKVINDVSSEKKELISKMFLDIEMYKHQNLVDVLNLYSNSSKEEDEMEMTLIYETGNNLKELSSNYSIFNETLFKNYVIQILIGLDFLHSKKIIHKNLIISNLIVIDEGTVKINDWLVDNIILGNGEELYTSLINDTSGEINYYIPPFFAESKGKTMNKSYDYWFLGCILVELSSGCHPWKDNKSKTQKEFIKFIANTKSKPPYPDKISNQFKEFLDILFDYNQTSQNGIFQKLFSLQFFSGISIKLLGSKFYINQNDSNPNTISMINNSNSLSLGEVLKRAGVMNILNSSGGATFTISASNINRDSGQLSQNGSSIAFKESINFNFEQEIQKKIPIPPIIATKKLKFQNNLMKKSIREVTEEEDEETNNQTLLASFILKKI